MAEDEYDELESAESEGEDLDDGHGSAPRNGALSYGRTITSDNQSEEGELSIVDQNVSDRSSAGVSSPSQQRQRHGRGARDADVHEVDAQIGQRQTGGA